MQTVIVQNKIRYLKEELAKLDKPSGISGGNGQKRKMSLFKSDKVGSSKTQK